MMSDRMCIHQDSSSFPGKSHNICAYKHVNMSLTPLCNATYFSYHKSEMSSCILSSM